MGWRTPKIRALARRLGISPELVEDLLGTVNGSVSEWVKRGPIDRAKTLLTGQVTLERCITEYLKEKTPSKSPGTRELQLEIQYEQRLARARARERGNGRRLKLPKKRRPKPDGTQYFDRLALNSFKETLPPGILLSEVKLLHLLRHRRLLLSPEDGTRPLKPQSVTRREGPIRNLFRYAIAMEYIERSPFAELEPLKATDERQRRPLKRTELKKLLAHAETWLFRMILFGAETGARRSQLCFLVFGSIDWAKEEVRFEARRRFNPKGRKTTVVPLSLRALRMLKDIQREAKARGSGGAEDFVFTDRDGGFVRPDRLTREMSRLIHQVLGENADVGAAVQALRITAANFWHERGGATLVDCKTLLGHSSAKTTDKHYLKSSSERLKKVVRKRHF